MLHRSTCLPAMALNLAVPGCEIISSSEYWGEQVKQGLIARRRAAIANLSQNVSRETVGNDLGTIW